MSWLSDYREKIIQRISLTKVDKGLDPRQSRQFSLQKSLLDSDTKATNACSWNRLGGEMIFKDFRI